MVEIWRPCYGLDGYEASNLGRVRSWFGNYSRTLQRRVKLASPRICAQSPTGGRLTTTVNGKTRPVSILIMLAFAGPCPVGMEVCHNDGNPLNNRVDNLRYDTHINNKADQIKHGTDCRGEKHYKAKLTAIDVLEIRQKSVEGASQYELADEYGVTRGNIAQILAGKSWAWLD